MHDSSKKRLGFSLIEMLVYVGVLTIIFVVVINTILSFTSTYHTLSALRAADHAGIDSMEHITRDIRAAASASVTTLSATSTTLTLVTTSAGVSTSTRFYVQNNTLKEDINGSYYGPLTASDVSVTSLLFTALATTSTTAVKVDMTVQGTSGSVTKIKQFHSTIVLRGS